MPRVGRAVLPNYPHHIIQRGHNRQVVLVEAGDFERYLETLADFKDIYGVKVYAWCLMTNHANVGVRLELPGYWGHDKGDWTSCISTPAPIELSTRGYRSQA